MSKKNIIKVRRIIKMFKMVFGYGIAQSGTVLKFLTVIKWHKGPTLIWLKLCM